MSGAFCQYAVVIPIQNDARNPVLFKARVVNCAKTLLFYGRLLTLGDAFCRFVMFLDVCKCFAFGFLVGSTKESLKVS